MLKPLILSALALALAPVSIGQGMSSISSCYLFCEDGGLQPALPNQLPQSSAKPRVVKTAKGEETVSRTAGWRVLYYNHKRAPFVNLKVEVSSPESYQNDQEVLVRNLAYLIKNGKNMSSKKPLELTFNGYTVYGLSRNSIAEGSTLGTYLIFPGDNKIVYVYFSNLKPEKRQYETFEEYATIRDQFLEAYTRQLATCE